jgi:hypothetical protein
MKTKKRKATKTPKKSDVVKIEKSILKLFKNQMFD